MKPQNQGQEYPSSVDLTPTSAVVGIIMGSSSDWDTMKEACEILKSFDVEYEARVVSAHRTPHYMVQYASKAAERGLKVLVAGAGGAAHLPGMVASCTILPVLGVPVQSRTLNGLDSLLSIVQMPGGIPVGTMAIGSAGAKNAGLLAARILAVSDSGLAAKISDFMAKQTQAVLSDQNLK
jgi:5-(carboxyamino)imidazole ribonucleotide mutase